MRVPVFIAKEILCKCVDALLSECVHKQQ